MCLLLGSGWQSLQEAGMGMIVYNQLWNSCSISSDLKQSFEAKGDGSERVAESWSACNCWCDVNSPRHATIR